jgi:hypothetical protein
MPALWQEAFINESAPLLAAHQICVARPARAALSGAAVKALIVAALLIPPLAGADVLDSHGRYTPSRENDATAQCSGAILEPYVGTDKFERTCRVFAELMHQYIEKAHLPCDSVSLLWMGEKRQVVSCLIADPSDRIIGNQLVTYEGIDNAGFKKVPTLHSAAQVTCSGPVMEELSAENRRANCAELARRTRLDYSMRRIPCDVLHTIWYGTDARGAGVVITTCAYRGEMVQYGAYQGITREMPYGSHFARTWP